jgi:hypothetical protein
MTGMRIPLSDVELTKALTPSARVSVPPGIEELIAADVRATPQRNLSLFRWPRPLAPRYPDQPNRWAMVLAVGLLTVALLAAAITASRLLNPPLPHGNGDIYVQFRNAFVVVAPDGSKLSRREFPGLVNPSAAWSPRGDLIAYWGAATDHTSRVVLTAPDGSTVEEIEPGAAGLPPNVIPGLIEWSPSGSSLILDGDIGGVTHIFRIDMAQPRFVDITPVPIYGRSPSWSGDGQIAFVPADQSQWGRQPWIMSSTGQGARPLIAELPDEMRIDGISWSPDGGRLVIQASNGFGRIYLVDRDGSHLRQLASSLPYPFVAGWSPDGRSLLVGNFLGTMDDEIQVYLADTEDDGLTLLKRNAEPLGYSPDGQAVLVSTPACAWDRHVLNECDQSVWKIDPETGEAGPLVSADRLNTVIVGEDHQGVGFSIWRAVHVRPNGNTSAGEAH